MNFKKWILKIEFQEVNFEKWISKIKIQKVNFVNWISKSEFWKFGKSLVWEEKIVGAATIVADSRV